MDKELLSCILSCKGQKKSFTDCKKIFMYVKNYCSHSEAAAKYAKTLLNTKDIHVLDVLTNKYVSPDDLKQPTPPKPDTHLIQAYNTLKKYAKTVPQIFVLTSNGWSYVGGKSDFIGASNKTMETMFREVKF